MPGSHNLEDDKHAINQTKTLGKYDGATLIKQPIKSKFTHIFPGGCFKYILFSTLLGEMIQFDEHIFHVGGSTTT